MTIRYAEEKDYLWLKEHDNYISFETLKVKIAFREIYVALEDNELIGWLRYNLFWDNVPFVNMIYILEDYRGKGYGKRLAFYWANEMKDKGYKGVMTSTQSNEEAQHFYRSLMFTEIGGFKYLEDPYEIMFYKKL